MTIRTRMQHLGAIPALSLALALTLTAPALAQATSPLFARADSVTPEDPNKVVAATVWLSLHDKKVLDDTVAKLYQTGSPTYHHWLKSSDLSHFAPTSADVETVKTELKSQGLSIDSVGARNMFVKVSGPVSKMQTAFHTEIMNLSTKGEVMHATTTEPKLGGAAASVVSTVSGLTGSRMKPYSVRAFDPDTKKPYPGVPLAKLKAAHPDGIFFAGDCFRYVQTKTFKTPGASLPIATYTGNRFGADITNTSLGTLAPCGYDAAEFTTAYGLPSAYTKGLDGTGQTIVIVDSYGSSTIWDDANAFSEINGLPLLTPSNFQVIYPGGPPQPTSPDNAAGWEIETSLDVEWAHAVAPGANIVLLVAPSDFDTDQASAIFYGIVNQFGAVISNSYGGPEAEYLAEYPAGLIYYDLVTELGAALGISVDFSSGDDGDFEAAVGVKTVDVPGDTPYATSVGGTSLAINKNNTLQFQTGWGNNFMRLALANGAPVDPPLAVGFQYGSGGGESQAFLKPSWQSSLPGIGRQQPDISLDADPDTGVEVVFTEDGEQLVGVVGGTSVASPTFSAFWAIANQRAGQLYGEGALLGQAAPIVASLAGTDAIRDVTAYTTPTNLAGIIFDAGGATYYSPNDLAAPLENTTDYYSALYNSPTSGRWDAFTFGTDSSLVVGPGWDNVTGYGSPNGLNFIKAAARGVAP